MQFGLGLGFLYLSPAMRKALSSVHKPMGFVVIIAGLAVILVRSATLLQCWLVLLLTTLLLRV